jgi:hypothetical protein
MFNRKHPSLSPHSQIVAVAGLQPALISTHVPGWHYETLLSLLLRLLMGETNIIWLLNLECALDG